MKFISICLFFKNLSNQGVELWMQERSEDGPLDGYLEFPGGKIEKGESPREACLREAEEELNLSVEIVESIKKMLFFFKFYNYEYPDRKVKLHVYLCPHQLDRPELGKWQSLSFVSKHVPISEKILPANGQIIDDVLDFLAHSSKHLDMDDAWRLLSQSQNFF
jgi:8-oxo-dGTP diphosphatase